MSTKILDQRLQSLRISLTEIVKDLHGIAIDNENHDLAKTVNDLRDRVNEPFMFVIVGEVKAGKSSFVNALLSTGREIVKVAPDPCTDTIQQVIYGEKEETLVVNPYLKKIFLPVETLQDISIVDTPGTNTIIDHHQEITENFIPASDLIVFVFEAKNPYRQSAWAFFDYIHEEWRKKIIFVLQQKDLMPNDDLAINIKGVFDYALKKGISDPNVFAVSAKQEQEGELGESGFLGVRDYIQSHITGGKAPYLKLANNIDTALNINGRIRAGLHDREAQLASDRAFRVDIKETLVEQEGRSAKQVDLLVENVLGSYDKITRESKRKLSSGLGFFTLAKRSILSVFSKESSVKEWLDKMHKDLDRDLSDSFQDKLSDGVMDIAENIQQMAKIIDLKIKNSQTILKNNHDIFGNIADRRSVVLFELQERFKRFLKKEENFIGEEIFAGDVSFSPDIATGSGIAVVGVVLATVTQGMVLDITGGIVTTIGLLFAGITVSLKKNKFLTSYQKEIDEGRERLEKEIDGKLKSYIRHIKDQIDNNFRDFDAMLEIENKQILTLVEKNKQIEERLTSMDVSVPEPENLGTN
ncbi:MAG: dynamin family protein [Bacteroidota bacterium]